ncbi:MAG: Trypsin-like protease [uncultured Corynebacteriales bacterium]|uniref:Trypsin-like protease n=1 Tax=uncultured Mycobacteriales bacterium TaxID=581187 RepID=A0A6J4I3G0_9ACTN|nr:MAG: Trypsin-like protease [uncultured Corynebacteriales bacterium]
MKAARRWGAASVGVLVALSVGLLGQTQAAAAPVGGPSPSVVGGTNAAQGEFPWMTRLSMGCGGAVIAQRVVLTAAHCVRRTGSYTGYTATINRANLTNTSVGQSIGSTYVYRSPQYSSTGTYDWALVELASAPSVAPLSIANQGETSLNSGTFTVMGWGATYEGGPQTNALKKASVPFVSDSVCAQSYRELAPATEICAGYTSGGVDTCQGDSGGPMVKNVNGVWRSVGIVSYGNGCARPNYPGVYSEIQAFSNAIRAKISASGTIIR